MIFAADVIRCGRAYLGTRYAHQGRSAAGMDCAGLVIRVAHDLGLSRFDTTAYGRIPRGDHLRELMDAHCTLVTERQPGTVALMKFEAEPQHLAFVTDHPQGLGLLHALAANRKVVEHRMDSLWSSRILAVYRLPGVKY